MIIKPNNNTISAITALPAGVGGKVLQVVQDTTATEATTNSTSFTDTALSVAITPSASSSKILLMFASTIRGDNSAGNSNYTLVRGSTNLSSSGHGMVRTQQAKGGGAINFLDTPSTTDATTYKVQFKSTNVNNNAYIAEGDCTASLIAIEIGA